MKTAARAATKAPPRSVDEYLARLPTDQRAALTKIRWTIKAAAPRATEHISYQMPTFKLSGAHLVSFAGAKAHCALYGMSSAVERFGRELERFDAKGGTIRFRADKPLPATLVTKLVKARAAEIEAG